MKNQKIGKTGKIFIAFALAFLAIGIASACDYSGAELLLSQNRVCSGEFPIAYLQGLTNCSGEDFQFRIFISHTDQRILCNAIADENFAICGFPVYDEVLGTFEIKAYFLDGNTFVDTGKSAMLTINNRTDFNLCFDKKGNLVDCSIACSDSLPLRRWNDLATIATPLHFLFGRMGDSDIRMSSVPSLSCNSPTFRSIEFGVNCYGGAIGQGPDCTCDYCLNPSTFYCPVTDQDRTNLAYWMWGPGVSDYYSCTPGRGCYQQNSEYARTCGDTSCTFETHNISRFSYNWSYDFNLISTVMSSHEIIPMVVGENQMPIVQYADNVAPSNTNNCGFFCEIGGNCEHVGAYTTTHYVEKCSHVGCSETCAERYWAGSSTCGSATVPGELADSRCVGSGGGYINPTNIYPSVCEGDNVLCYAEVPLCGDGICDVQGGETCWNCPQDCGGIADGAEAEFTGSCSSLGCSRCPYVMEENFIDPRGCVIQWKELNENSTCNLACNPQSGLISVNFEYNRESDTTTPEKLKSAETDVYFCCNPNEEWNSKEGRCMIKRGILVKIDYEVREYTTYSGGGWFDDYFKNRYGTDNMAEYLTGHCYLAPDHRRAGYGDPRGTTEVCCGEAFSGKRTGAVMIKYTLDNQGNIDENITSFTTSNTHSSQDRLFNKRSTLEVVVPARSIVELVYQYDCVELGNECVNNDILRFVMGGINLDISGNVYYGALNSFCDPQGCDVDGADIQSRGGPIKFCGGFEPGAQIYYRHCGPGGHICWNDYNDFERCTSGPKWWGKPEYQHDCDPFNFVKCSYSDESKSSFTSPGVHWNNTEQDFVYYACALKI